MPEYVDPTDPGLATVAAMQRRARQPAQRPTPVPGQPDTLSYQAIMNEIDAQATFFARIGIAPTAIYLSRFAQQVLSAALHLTRVSSISVHVWGVGTGRLPVMDLPDDQIAARGDVAVDSPDGLLPPEALPAAGRGGDARMHPLGTGPTITPEMQSARLKALTGESSDELRRRMARELTDGTRDRETGDRIDADPSPST